MVIAVNARCIQYTRGITGNYAAQLLRQLVTLHPEHRWLLVSDVPLPFSFPSSVEAIVTGKPVTNTLGLQRWLNKTLPAVMAAHQANVLLCFDGTAPGKGNHTIITGFTGEAAMPGQHGFLQKLRLKSLARTATERATAMFAIAQPVATMIARAFVKDVNAITLVPQPAADIFRPIDWEEKNALLNTFTGGKEFFLFTQGFESNGNLLNVLKAFSLFKKWQQSDMKLVVTGDTTDADGAMQEKINTYRYRSDVVLRGTVDDATLHQLMAASYAMVYTPSDEVFGMPVLQAMQSGTAVICAKKIDAALGSDIVWYADESDHETISRQLIQVYKDEINRSRHIQAGIAHAAQYTWEASARKLWQVIQSCISTE